MNSSPRLVHRRTIVLSSSVLGVVLLFSCCNPITTPTPPVAMAHITLCAVDPAYTRNAAATGDPQKSYCGPGDFQAVHQTQLVEATAYDKHGVPMPFANITLRVSGANAGPGITGTVALGTGHSVFSYTGNHPGDDSITATFTNGTPVATETPAVVRWLTTEHYIHPILFVHGIDEDASDYETQIDPAFTDSEGNTLYADGGDHDKGEQVFTGLIGALELKYDRTYMEAFCYVDDQAYLNTPSGCHTHDLHDAIASPCGTPQTCVSQSSVDTNSVELANTINALSTQAQAAINTSQPGTSQVTIVAYSMGAAITRSFLSGCVLAQTLLVPGASQCASVASLVDNVFFIDGAQQGAWVLEANKTLNAASLATEGSPSGPGSPFASILPTIQQAIYTKFQNASGGLDARQPAVTDLTPGSPSVLAHDTVPIPSSIGIYNFYGDVQLKLSVTALIYTLPPRATLNLGDLLMLAQKDGAQSAPTWGGAGLCGSCSALNLDTAPAIAPVCTGGTLPDGSPQYHAWALLDPHTLDINAFTPLLTVSNARSGFDAALNSPVWHLNTTQPITMAPGSRIQVQDLTGHANHTDVPTEILYVLTHKDGVSIP
jgi:hypothetical protein